MSNRQGHYYIDPDWIVYYDMLLKQALTLQPTNFLSKLMLMMSRREEKMIPSFFRLNKSKQIMLRDVTVLAMFLTYQQVQTCPDGAVMSP